MSGGKLEPVSPMRESSYHRELREALADIRQLVAGRALESVEAALALAESHLDSKHRALKLAVERKNAFTTVLTKIVEHSDRHGAVPPELIQIAREELKAPMPVFEPGSMTDRLLEALLTIDQASFEGVEGEPLDPED